MGWTKEQKQAIDLRGKNLLVSAAAGSGKTAVLVERIVKMVCEENYDIDKILVVTFTKAAAAEMKERIGNRLLQEGISHPDNGRIQEQLSYIHRAPISTIHSFCTGLLRNHFHMISLDPGFRIGEEGEVALLKEQVLGELLEECYARGEESFLRFVEAYSYGRDDRVIADMILRLFEFSISHPMPEKWLAEAVESLDMKNGEPEWLIQTTEYGNRILEDAVLCLDRAIAITQQESLLVEKYLPFLLEEREKIKNILKIEDYTGRCEAFRALEFKRSPAVRTKDPVIKEMQEGAKALRDEAKNMVLHLEQDCYRATFSRIQWEGQWLKPYVEVLVNLVLAFSKKYAACKKEKNLLEFHDLEHYALKLLVADYKDGQVVKTPLAEELAASYQAVFTDEYQDSNLIQEVLLKAVSREEIGNRFMVGDIKQSIYKFRMARPELFLNKYALGEQDKMHVNVELRNNFRSKPEVLYAINHIFYQIMKPSLGGVLYEEKVALMPPEEKKKALEEEIVKGTETTQELWIVDLEKEEKKDKKDKEWQEESKVELEAKMIAGRIKEFIRDESQGYSYKDIVILLRTMEGWASAFEEILTMEGIPVHTESRKGYFDTFEIRVLLNVLSVVDNIYQDIPMAAVLRSPIGGFTGEELAGIRSLVIGDKRKEDSLYEEMEYYLETGEEPVIKEKIRKILTLLFQLREEKTRLSLPELIWSFLEKTDYYHLVGSMPNGEQRMANIRMFLEKAGEYEKTSFKGVFHFVQYIEQLRSYDIDYGEASVLGEEADVVRIMSIHKSKGLEFPVVILAGTGKTFNFMDRNQRMLLHPDYYIGLDCIDLTDRTKRPSQQKKMISRQLTLSMLGEELRVLYVAMTRARNKLIITGTMDDFAKKMREMGDNPGAYLTFGRMTKAVCYLDWIFPAMLTTHSLDGYRESYGMTMPEDGYYEIEGEPVYYDMKVIPAALLLGKTVVSRLKDTYKQEEFFDFMKKGTKEESLLKEMEAAFSWTYSKWQELKSRSKWSVSRLKEESMEEEVLVPVEESMEEQMDRQIEKSLSEGKDRTSFEGPKIIPAFLQEKAEEEVLSGAGRGTIIHKLMEEISFAKAEEKGVKEAVAHLISSGSFPKEREKMIPIAQLKAFITSDLGQRMANAERCGNLYKEAQFMIGVPMREMEPDVDSDEPVLVQGIIDVYMEEEDGLVLLDYKTDYVEKGQGEKLVEKYRTQLQWYKRALEQMTGRPVKETFIYSFRLSQCLVVDKI